MSGGAVLALDLATSTGWARMDPGGGIAAGTWDFKPKRKEKPGIRFLRFYEEMDAANRAAGGFEAVVYEEVRNHKGVTAAHIYGGLVGILLAYCAHHNIPCDPVPVGTWKRELTGKGDADKPAVMAKVRELGYDPKTQDAADAIGILLCVTGS